LANQAALQAAHDALESRVTERTAALVEANEQLADEVGSRKVIESNLRATQDELVHAGKMAVLGQLSAGMVHEINQPLAAMRTLSDTACMLIGLGRTDEACSNLRRVAQLTDRLGSVTRQLTVFAHKARQPPKPAVVQRAVASAQFLLSHRVRERDVEIETSISPADLAALADEVRLEQVLVNLIGNGIDAVSGEPMRRIYIEAKQAGGRCVISVSDTGSGIRADVLSRLFEPFVTTKAAGAGLGLGLVISTHIVRDSGGSLRAANLDDGGACFVIDLPLASGAGEPTQVRAYD
jgi:two-component system, NtrC family, C4-dicarboxylate transport sensor histidine kinase DctB